VIVTEAQEYKNLRRIWSISEFLHPLALFAKKYSIVILVDNSGIFQQHHNISLPISHSTMQNFKQVTSKNTILLFITLLFFTACGNDDVEEKESYDVRGRYLSTDMHGESVSIVHETIPDVMDAMRMSLRIEDESVAEGLETGDHIRFRMVRTDQGWYIRDVEKLPGDTELDLPEDLREIGL